MQTNYNVTTPKAAPAFGAIQYDMAKDTLKAVMNSKQLGEFVQIVEKQKANELVDVVLFGTGKKLSANVVDNAAKLGTDNYKCTPYSQRFLEAPMSFIKRMCEKVEKRTAQAREIIAKNELLK